jgi:ubiquitin C-terminal hydrolase
VKSLEDGLVRYTEPELLAGDNRWYALTPFSSSTLRCSVFRFCEKCGTKVDALKGLQFDTLPPLLTLQLKRFDFDYQVRQKRETDKDRLESLPSSFWSQKMRRFKLHHRVSFPFELNMKSYLPEGKNSHPANYALFAVLVHSGKNTTLREGEGESEREKKKNN